MAPRKLHVVLSYRVAMARYALNADSLTLVVASSVSGRFGRRAAVGSSPENVGKQSGAAA